MLKKYFGRSPGLSAGGGFTVAGQLSNANPYRAGHEIPIFISDYFAASETPKCDEKELAP
jgi:hypothetical protein